MARKKQKLTVDPEFRDLIPPLLDTERKLLEENIVKEGCRDPIALWGDVILDGHNRYEICRKNGISFDTVQVPVYNREEALAWICANQLGKRNISEETRRYLIGKRYAMEKMIGAHNPSGRNQHSKEEVRATMLPRPHYDDTACRTRERLAKEYHISHTTVLKYEYYSQAMDYLTEIVPELVPKILSGQVKVSQENIVELAKLPPIEIRRLGLELAKGNMTSAGYTTSRRVMPGRQDAKGQPIVPSIAIKNTPAYDPDAEVSSLTLTIPSWVSSINRTRSLANMDEVTADAKEKLVRGLKSLRESIDEMLESIGGVDE